MRDHAEATRFDIRLAVGAAEPEIATELLRSMVHHHGARSDAPLAMVEALDAAIDDLMDAIWRSWGAVDTIEMGSSTERLDLRLAAPPDRARRPPVTLGPVAAALFAREAGRPDSEIVLSCDLSAGHR